MLKEQHLLLSTPYLDIRQFCLGFRSDSYFFNNVHGRAFAHNQNGPFRTLASAEHFCDSGSRRSVQLALEGMVEMLKILLGN